MPFSQGSVLLEAFFSSEGANDFMSDSFSVSIGVYNLDVCNFFARFSFVGKLS